jgi:hypothetical protein
MPPPTEAEALLEVAQAIRDLPALAKRAERAQPFPAMTGIRQIMDSLDPERVRQRNRERIEEERAKRSELRANIAISIAALGALGSILAVVFH